jgi:hypothetical protein
MNGQRSFRMSRFLRRALLGAAAAFLASLLVAAIGQTRSPELLWGTIVGIAYSLVVPPARGTYMEQAMTAGAIGFPIWGLLLPLKSSGHMRWSAEAMRSDFPVLVAWVLFGVVFGTLLQALTDLAEAILGPEYSGAVIAEGVRKRIVILGGGFAGMKTAERLEKFAVILCFLRCEASCQ